MAYINGKEILFSPTIEGYELGKQAQYDAFWDSYLAKGATRKYAYAFAGICWSDNNFYPKHNIICGADAGQCFYNSQVSNIKARLEECGVKLDTSKATGLYQAFYYAVTKELPEISAENATNLYCLFNSNPKLTRVDKLILKADGTSPHLTNICVGCTALEYIRFEGLIGTSITMSSCSLLSVDSAKSIIEHLANYADTENEGKYTVKLHANTWAALEADGKAPDGNTWADYVTTTLGWLI